MYYKSRCYKRSQNNTNGRIRYTENCLHFMYHLTSQSALANNRRAHLQLLLHLKNTTFSVR